MNSVEKIKYNEENEERDFNIKKLFRYLARINKYKYKNYRELNYQWEKSIKKTSHSRKYTKRKITKDFFDAYPSFPNI